MMTRIIGVSVLAALAAFIIYLAATDIQITPEPVTVPVTHPSTSR